MVTCCDTSFLFSLYIPDAHSPQALAFLAEADQPLALTMYLEFEFANALHFSVFRGILASTKARSALSDLALDKDKGVFLVSILSAAATFEKARHLSESYTREHGFRSFDIVHVAAAHLLGAQRFLTFDDQQARLARLVGLETPLA